ncbi:MAG: phosphate propanoyltransferase [Christensenellaceae bacterium]|jgi:putative phosphotransacetylase|nr:phosphate propanoyltransferase [Christensenellaceae bacterium]
MEKNIEKEFESNIEISARHVHLCKDDFVRLFGTDATLGKVRELSVVGEYLSDKSVSLVGAKRSFDKVSVLGPLRAETQVEISRTDCFTIGEKNVPLRISGDLQGSAPIKIIGSVGEIDIKQGLIVAKRHLHISPADAKKYGVTGGDILTMKFDGERGGTFDNVIVRVANILKPTVHLDTDEGNAISGNIGGKNITFCLLKKQ